MIRLIFTFKTLFVPNTEAYTIKYKAKFKLCEIFTANSHSAWKRVENKTFPFSFVYESANVERFRSLVWVRFVGSSCYSLIFHYNLVITVTYTQSTFLSLHTQIEREIINYNRNSFQSLPSSLSSSSTP